MSARLVTVEAERLAGWLERFTARHGPAVCTADATVVTVTAADGSVARLTVPFPPLVVREGEAYGGLLPHVVTDRRVGVLLVRLGGFAVGVAEGPRIVTSKVGSRHVQGRTAAGGWSQQRFARRREGQAKVAFGAAADVAARLLAPVAGSLDAVVVGGDRRAVDTVLGDVRLAALVPLVQDRRLDVPDPKLAVLQAAPARFRAVTIDVHNG